MIGDKILIIRQLSDFGWSRFCSGPSAVDIEVQADDLRHTVDTVLGLIADDTGQEVERIFADSLHDHWYTAAEARDYGFID